MEASIVRPCERAEFLIDFNPRAGRLQVSAPGVFNRSRRGFGRALIERAISIPGVLSASLDLAASVCHLHVEADTDLPVLAEDFAEALRVALAAASCHTRSESQWEVLAAFREHPSVTLWEGRLSGPGRLDLRWSPNRAHRLDLLPVADQLARRTGVRSCRIGFWPHRLLVDFDDSTATAFDLLHESHQSWIEARSIVDPGITPILANQTSKLSGFQRIPYLALAGGCLLLTLGGLVLPGIPTVPFLVASSFFLARSAPSLHGHLLHMPYLGPILQEWERYRGFGAASKYTLRKLSLGLVVLSVALDPLDPVALGLTLLFGSLSLYGIQRVPAAPLPPPEESFPV